jgi:MFS family permease
MQVSDVALGRESAAVEVEEEAGEEDSAKLRHNLSCITRDGAAYSVMVGAGETYLAAFLLAMGKSDRVCGLVGTIPMLFGAMLQLFAPWGVQQFASHRRWVTFASALQGLCFIPLCLAAMSGAIHTGWAFAIVSMYWACGLAGGAAWNAWAETLVPRPMRAGFFAYRTRVAQIALLASLIGAGLMLQYSGLPDATTFAWLFAISGVARLVSAFYLSEQSEGGRTPPATPSSIVAMCRDWLKENRRDAATNSKTQRAAGKTSFSAWQLLAFLVMMQMAVYISGPYFTPYMLRVLDMSYLQLASLTAAAYLARILTLPWLGRLVAQYGPRRVLWVCAIGIVPLPAAWILSTNFQYLLFVQLVCGLAWGGYELAMVLLFFDSIPREKRVEMLTLYNFANAAAMALGTFVGAWWLSVGGEQLVGYFGLFALSSSMRLIPLAFLVRLPSRLKHHAHVVMRTLALRPGAGSINRPILPSLSDDEKELHHREVERACKT